MHEIVIHFSSSEYMTDAKVSRFTGIPANRKGDLLRLARMPAATQSEIAHMIARGEARTVSKACALVEQAQHHTQTAASTYPPAPSHAFDLLYAALPWDNATLSVDDYCRLPQRIGLQMTKDARLFFRCPTRIWRTR